MGEEKRKVCLLSKYSLSPASRVESECVLLKLKLIAMNIEFENGAHSAITQNYFKLKSQDAHTKVLYIFFSVSFLISFQCLSR